MKGLNVKPSEGHNSATPPSLLDSVKAKEPLAWERLVHLFSPLVYRWCRQAGLQEADAADVGQEVFKAVVAAVADFRHDRPGDTLRGWLRVITSNKIHDFRRKMTRQEQAAGGSRSQQKLQSHPDSGDLPTEDESSVREDNLLIYRRAVEMILANCEDATRTAFMRVVIERQPVKDVAGELGLSVNAIYVAKSRILRRLREEFAGLIAD